ncbi:Ppx/GppA phosphatase family protein [Luteimicrobium xylanilyticum]|uniref:Exopolyphosphatase n=1 Tax=Luteimicrobium xylanilyticum TaxID=1133546 RepID=A0A5P9Q7X8_9MICO|nr:Ppx/GppA phosphatase family protein [Luteimicrobium xylanilyticum]QFU97548.1 Exopolyphosphatase [Luteimicrobium xylanilyticum]
MRLGVLDVGSNTVHLLVVDAYRGAPPLPQSSHRSTLRLMRLLEPSGAISPAGVEAVLAAVDASASQARQAGLDELLAFATSAVRDAPNGPDLLALVTERTGVELQVLSGEDEARITYLAVRRWFGWSAGRLLLIDIGGGSLEVATGATDNPDLAVSLPLGAGRTTAAFLPDDPPTDAQVDDLRRHARDMLEPAAKEFADLPAPGHVVGTSKTIRSLARLAGDSTDGIGERDRTVLTREALDDWIPRIARIPVDARDALPGITTDRAYQVVGGAVVLSETMRALGVSELDVSPWALREGLILRYLDGLE